MPVTSLAARLPDIATVRRWSQSLALLDAIVSPEWQYRYFSFDAHWAADQENCLWRRREDAAGRHGSVTFPPGADPDGADWLFEQLDGQPDTYRSFALDYYEKEIDLAPIRHIYRHEPVSDQVVSALNAQLSLSDIADDLHEIGYRATQLGRHS